MMAAATQLGSSQLGGLAGSSTSAGTTPSSLCSTPVTLLSAAAAQNQLMNFLPQMQYSQQMQLQQANAFEGMPIFILPQNGVGSNTVSLAALQRAAEVKAGLLNVPVEPKVDTSKHHHIFIGDLSPEVDNKMLKDAFSTYGEVSEAKVIRDSQTQKSKGYGFVSFPVKENAEKAMTGMNGQWIGRRAIRTNWAIRRPTEEAKSTLTFEQVFNSTKADNTSVYVGNINPATTEQDLRDAFVSFGTINEIRIFKAQGYAFVRFERKEDATRAIMEMNGKIVSGNNVRCSWGRTAQQQHAATIAPLMTDFSPLLTPQVLPQYSNVAPQPFWPYPQYMNPMNALTPTILPQW